jgi:predicted aspartyl protease
MAKVKTLVDSRATENLVNKKIVRKLGMTLQELPLARNITNIDGTGNANGPIMRFCELRICHNKEEDIQKFYITNLGNNQVILGYPWLKRFSPHIDWINREVRGT